MKSKQVIFNIGAGFCSYLETGDKRILFDLGKSSDFCPVNDFLVPLFKIRNDNKNENNKYHLDQLFISHSHNDHLTSIKDFHRNFYPYLLTTPNDNEGMSDKDKINWELMSMMRYIGDTSKIKKYAKNG